VTDKNGVTIGVNKTYEEMSGLSNAELAGKSLHQLVNEDHVFSGSASQLVLEKKIPITATYYTKTDKKLLVKGKPIFDDSGEIVYIINTIWDLTDISYKQNIDSDTVRDSIVDNSEFVSCSPQMIQTLDMCMRVANTQSTILMTGESGVGKSLLASLIYQAGHEKGRPFIKLNCAAIPENLIESELFGYVKGAFTGADSKGKPGLFEAADGGVIFLDEISELPLYAQSKLLGVLQDKEFTPVGGVKSKKVDVRVIAATNKNLWKLVKEGNFREDLYYRLNVIPVEIPPLRNRPEDIAPMIQMFLEKFNKRFGCYKEVNEHVIDMMERSPWYGNVRELQNVIERLVVTSKGDVIDMNDYKAVSCGDDQIVKTSLKSQLESYERDILLRASQSCCSTRQLAKFLDVSQASIVRKLNKYGIVISGDSE
jgi:TyrR family helix-turn-helix protein/PAS domain S-box-containing protein